MAYEGNVIQSLDELVTDILRKQDESLARLQPIRAQVETFRCEIERGDTGNQNAVPCGEPYAKLCEACNLFVGPNCAKNLSCSGTESGKHEFSEN